NLMLIDHYDQDAFGSQQPPGKSEPLLHEAQPLAVAPGVFRIDVSVVVLPVPGPGVERGVEVDTVDPALVNKAEELQNVVVLAVDNDMERFLCAPLHAIDRSQR